MMSRQIQQQVCKAPKVNIFLHIRHPWKSEKSNYQLTDTGNMKGVKSMWIDPYQPSEQPGDNLTWPVGDQLSWSSWPGTTFKIDQGHLKTGDHWPANLTMTMTSTPGSTLALALACKQVEKRERGGWRGQTLAPGGQWTRLHHWVQTTLGIAPVHCSGPGSTTG